MKYYKLTKLSKNENALRTEEMKGHAEDPTQGESFIIVGKGLESTEGDRIISTSLIVDIVRVSKDKQLIHTINSTYELERLECSCCETKIEE
jgi:hypothetical protein